MHHVGGWEVFGEPAINPLGAALRAAEDDRLFGLVALEQLDKQIEFPLVVDREIVLVDRLDALRLRREVHHLGVAHVRAGEALDGRRDRGAEEQRLPLLGAAAEDFFDVGAKADVEHAVGLVEDDDLHGSQIEGAAAEVVEHAAGRADDHVGALLQLGDLPSDRLAAVNRHACNAPAVGELLEFIADLDCQLARGDEHQSLRRRGFATVNPLQDGDREGGRLAGAGAGLA